MMNSSSGAFVALILISMIVLGTTAAPSEFKRHPNAMAIDRAKAFRMDRVIVQMQASSTTPADKPRYRVMPVNPSETVEQAMDRYARQPGVEYVEPDYEQYATVNNNPPSYNDGDATTHYRSWGQKKISAPTAWDLHTNSSGVKVCVIDTGIDYNHDYLKNQMDTTYKTGFNAAKCALNTANPLSTTCTTPALDDGNHGTHCAGIIAGQGNVADKGIAGVNWGGASLIPCKFLARSGSGSIADAIECVTWCYAAGARIMSNSWGGGGYSKALEDEIRRVGNPNDPAVLVFANGNESSDMDVSDRQPASMNLPNMINVASSMASDTKSSFSNYGTSSSHIAAPGQYIWSSVIGNKFANYSGTSMATPYVAGAMALMKAKAGAGVDMLRIRHNLLKYGFDEITAGMTVPTSGKSKRLNLAKAVTNAAQNWTAPSYVSAPSGESTIALIASSGSASSSALTFGRTNNNWLTVNNDVTSVDPLKEIISTCGALNSQRFKINTWPKNFHKVTLSEFTNGTNATWDSGCGVTNWDTVMAVIKCSTSSSSVILNTCTCYVDDDGCGSGGGPSKVTNVPIDTAATTVYYVANVPFGSSVTSGSWKVNVVQAGASSGGSCQPAGWGPCTSGTQCCSGQCSVRSKCK